MVVVEFDWHLLNICQFVYFIWGLSPPKRRVVRVRNFGRRRVPTMCTAGHVLVLCQRVVDTKNDIFQKITYMYANSFAGVTGRSACWAGWLQRRPVLLITLLLIAQALGV